MNKAIIVDLDDTIFQTRSMDARLFAPFFNHLSDLLRPVFAHEIIDCIIADLWKYPWDVVIRKYKIPGPVFLQSVQVLEALDLKPAISTYPDYIFIKEMTHPKFLVTTSLTSLQQSKIRALNIERDFTRIIINDPFAETKTKLDIFRELVAEFNLNPATTYVIGDNPESEIKAGNALDMVTIQILRDQVVKGDNARHYIQSFSELAAIIGA